MADSVNEPECITVIPTGAALGAEITGLDLTRPLPKETVSTLRSVVLEYCVIFFRDQSLDDTAQVAFTHYFGPASVHVRDNQPDRETEEIMMVSNVRENGKLIGSLGHGEGERGGGVQQQRRTDTDTQSHAIATCNRAQCNHPQSAQSHLSTRNYHGCLLPRALSHSQLSRPAQ